MLSRMTRIQPHMQRKLSGLRTEKSSRNECVGKYGDVMSVICQTKCNSFGVLVPIETVQKHN